MVRISFFLSFSSVAHVYPKYLSPTQYVKIILLNLLYLKQYHFLARSRPELHADQTRVPRVQRRGCVQAQTRLPAYPGFHWASHETEWFRDVNKTVRKNSFSCSYFFSIPGRHHVGLLTCPSV